MKETRSYRYLLPALAVALACVCAVFAVAFMQTWREHNAFQERESAAREHLSELQANNATQQKYLTQLLNDPVLLERAARERLGFSREGEMIFKFAE